MNKILPEVSVWYQELISGALFEVVAIDKLNSTIEYQLLDGEVSEYDLSTWSQLLSAKPKRPRTGAPLSSLTAKIKSTQIKCLSQRTSLAHFWILSRIHCI